MRSAAKRLLSARTTIAHQSAAATTGAGCCSLLSGVKSLYLHWPFCAGICHYCDFNKFKAPRNGGRDGVVEQLEQAMLQCASDHFSRHEEECQVHSVFWGGGTPSLARAEFIAELHSRLPLSTATEVTLEANPTAGIAPTLTALHQAGINRLSIGVQSFRDADLKVLGRQHSYKDAIKSIEAATSIFGENNVSIDLMYGLPGQTVAAWDEVLELALSFNLGHMSLYELTIKPNTRFHKLQQAGKFHHEPLEDLYFHAANKLVSRGYDHYEVSNYCKPGREAQHNVHHWQGGEYVGIGPGAVGRYTRNSEVVLAEPYMKPKDWIASVRRGERGVESYTPMPSDEVMAYTLATGLRMRCGVCLQHFGARFGPALTTALTSSPLARQLLELGYVDVVDGAGNTGGEGRAFGGGSSRQRLVPTEKGMAVGDAVQEQLCTAVFDVFAHA
ncbi:hypothetical protein PTSG_02077 [Salpingoeca rosetta]|uniref:Radical S-adenosyl methionine domain-containing protein 1, mitochondrial n=1 Tax=Salpingoeca rosetta (strain ATCC 50818 / BSB-021) TaxID=946362 RepID=F2U2K3_SALR5|nr:uncharacterized protein PTSG_02077 [Salpingoeca rosetta]EGD81358.1 hypothetical protein PTSG_02077 [Salpingoeca rosetta]|eukprot:XP_004996562.1 hypothetical protein PTSG_02077 [Salpingoeca rosetta]